MTESKAVAKRPIDKLKVVLNDDSIQQQFRNAMKDNAGPFIASIIDLYSSDVLLQECEPGMVIRECLKAATLNLPINKSLGQAYVIPYKVKGKMTPNFQIGYKGYIQLAQRTGQYRFINAGVVPEGMNVKTDFLTGQTVIEGIAKSDKAYGYFAYFELLNGFSKSKFMTVEEIVAHAKKYSKSYGSDFSPWKNQFDAMAIKTVILQLIPKYGPMSTEFIRAMDDEMEAEFREEVTENANKEPLTIPESTTTKADHETGEIIEETPVDEGLPY